MVGKWLIQYFDGSNWSDVPNTKFEGITEELNAHEEASFSIPNNAVNREFVLHDYPIKIFYDSIEVYSGLLQLVKYTMTSLTVTVYNQVYGVLQKRKFTGSFNNVSAADVLGAITGLGSGGSGGASVQNFGDRVIEPVVQHVGLEAKDAVKVKMLNVDGGSLTDIYGAIMTENGVSSNVKMAVYSDVDGVPTALLGVSDEVVLTASEITWTKFHFSTPIALLVNVDVWFAIQSNGGIYYALAWTGPNNVAFNYSAVYNDGFTDPFGNIDFSYTGVSASFYGVLSIPGSGGGGGTGGGECPTTTITTKYVDANSYDAAVGISKILNKDFWGNNYFNIGVRNTCVLALPFDDGSGFNVTDVSGYGNNGAIHPVAGNWTFGRSTIGDEDYAGSTNVKYASKFDGISGHVNKISAYVKRSSLGKIRCALYADASGSPGALLAQTLEVTVGTNYAWIDFPFATDQQPLTINTVPYWIVIATANAFTIKDQSGVGPTVNYNADTYSDDFANPFGSPSTTASKELCIYASVYQPYPVWVDGKYGKALQLNGYYNNVEIADCPSLRLTGGFTLCIWAKASAAFSGIPALLEKYKNYSLGIIASSGGDLYVSYFNDSSTWVNAQTTGYVFPQNIWTHVSVTFMPNGADTNVTFYVNGAQYGVTQTVTGHPVITSDPLIIGGRLTSDWWTGIIGETMIFSRALPAGEIKFHYDCVSRNSSTRTVDRSKLNSSVIINGTDLAGYPIVGVAGTGSDVHVLTQIEPADQATINKFAATALVKFSNQDTGSPVNLPIAAAAYLHPGDTLPLRIPQLDINSNYRIQKIVKTTAAAAITLEKPVVTIEKVLTQIQNSISQIQQSASGVTTGALTNYTVSTDGTYFFAINQKNICVYGGSGDNGGISGTDAAAVINAIIATGIHGTIDIQGNILATAPITLTMPLNAYTSLKFDSLTFTGFNANALSVVYSGAGSNGWLGRIDGNFLTISGLGYGIYSAAAFSLVDVQNGRVRIGVVYCDNWSSTYGVGVMLQSNLPQGTYCNVLDIGAIMGFAQAYLLINSSGGWTNCNTINNTIIELHQIAVNMVRGGAADVTGNQFYNIVDEVSADGSPWGNPTYGFINVEANTFVNCITVDVGAISGFVDVWCKSGGVAKFFGGQLEHANFVKDGEIIFSKVSGVPDTAQSSAVTSPAGKTLGVTYQNTLNQNIMVYVTVTITGNASYATNYATSHIGVSAPSMQLAVVMNTPVDVQNSLVFMVPAGWYYLVYATGSVTLEGWLEQTI